MDAEEIWTRKEVDYIGTDGDLSGPMPGLVTLQDKYAAGYYLMS
jgi:hypothetical protein